MAAIDQELREALKQFMQMTASRQPDQIVGVLDRMFQLEQQLGPDAPPMLRHYPERRSYQKALDFLNSGRPEMETPQCGH